ncbi:hypothetical protein [Falsibacillus pallidus]|uniref:Uncharacterized protein n=1 Tax=Falsibacillus pallidus TaxID=493781 RepID=A0A370GPX2_9BACI|nr:hypothetical protein [Falsibacillus pallidus]RDI45765.1 hypothetical protein DFR59_102399 [Falsibacillus pallidus]
MFYGMKFGLKSFLLAIVGIILEFFAQAVGFGSFLTGLFTIAGALAILFSLVYCIVSFIRRERGRWKYSGLILILAVAVAITFFPFFIDMYHFNKP